MIQRIVRRMAVAAVIAALVVGVLQASAGTAIAATCQEQYESCEQNCGDDCGYPAVCWGACVLWSVGCHFTCGSPPAV